MHTTIMILVATLRETFLSRASLQLENLALRQQVAILKRERRRPWLQTCDRLFWVNLSRLWPRWREALVIVRPETVIGWHRKGFRAFWTWKSRRRKPGRPPVPKDVRELIQRMSRENPLWGAPRIHGEILKLGIDVSQSTVTRYMVRHPKPPSQTWRTFLDNHVGCLVSIDFFVVPTATFAVLFVFIVLRHERRHVEHFGVTTHPSADWVAQQIREAFPWDTAPLFDSRPGRGIRAIVSLDGDDDGRGRGRHGAAKPVAESICGTSDWQREARMPEPRDRLE